MSTRRIKKKPEVAAQEKPVSNSLKTASLIIVIVVAVLCLAGIGFIIYNAINVKVNTTKSSSNFSAQLTDDGMMKGVTVENLVTTIEPVDIVFPLSEIEYPNDKITEDLEQIRQDHAQLLADIDMKIENGSEVNIDYSGTVNGEVFDGGTAEDQRLVVGEGTLIGDFEEQLIGHHPTDSFDINVTFPDDYFDQNLAGEDAVFAITVNGIYQQIDLTDDFIKENYGDYADTLEGYIEYLRTSNEEKNKEEYAPKYIIDYSSASSYPEKYVKNMKSLLKYQDEYQFAYLNNLYYQYQGSYAYSTFEDYTQMTAAEYEEDLLKKAQEQTLHDMAYQAFFKKAGLEVTTDDYDSMVESIGEDAVSTYGKGYIMQLCMWQKVEEYIAENATVE